jgi:hypothetical protein
MSQLKTNNITTVSNTGDPNIVLGDSGDTQVQSLNGGQLGGNRNLVINGDFRTWQRGTSFTNPNNDFTADRWRLAQTANDGTKIDSGVPSLDGTPFVGGIASIYNFPAGSTPVLSQPIELAYVGGGYIAPVSLGSSLTFSCYATSGKEVKINLRYFDNSGAPTSVVDISGGYISTTETAVSGGYSRYTATVTVNAAPVVASRCLHLAIQFLNATAPVNVGGVQLEPGLVATPFEQRPIGTELALCRRYYQVLPNQSKTIRAVSSSFAFADGSIPLQPPMRAVPTCSFSVLANSEITVAPVITQDPPSSVYGVAVGNGASGTSGQICYFAGTADAEL